MAEEWRRVPGLERYRVSNLGHMEGPRGRLKTPPNGDGYPVICVVAGLNQRKVLRVHRLVMLAFVGPCPDGMEVRHLDGNPANVALTNLAYGTRAENAMDRVRHGRAGGPCRRLTEAEVVMIRDLLEMEAPQQEIADYLGCSQATISNIATGRTWKLPPAVQP